MTLSEHLVRKWQNFFDFFDIKKEGRWSVEGFDRFADRLILQADHTVTQVGATHIRRHLQHWFSIHSEQLFRTCDVTESVVCKTMEYLLAANQPGRQAKDLDIFSEVWFDILDIDRDGRISEMDMRILYRSVGMRNLLLIGDMFHTLDLDKDHHLTREELRIGYREYFFGDQRNTNQEIVFLFDRHAGISDKPES